MKKSIFKKLGGLFLGLAMGLGVAVGVTAGNKTSEVRAATTTACTGDMTSTYSCTGGSATTSNSSKKSGYYQDGSSTTTFQCKSTTAWWTTTPSSITFTANLAGGSAKDPLTNNVYVELLNASGSAIGSAYIVTTKVTKTSTAYSVNISPVNNVYGVKLYHVKETSFNVRFYSFSLTYEPGASVYLSDLKLLDCPTSNLNIGDSGNLSYYGLDSAGKEWTGDVKYYSSNTSAIEVDETTGAYTTVGAGLSNLSCKAVGAGKNGADVTSDRVSVTVNEPSFSFPLTANPTLSGYSQTMFINGVRSTQELTVNYSPANSDETLVVTSSNSLILSVEEKTAPNSGTAVYTLTAIGNGEASITVAGAKGVYEATTSTITVATKTISSIKTSGEMTNKTYEMGGSWNPAGLIVTATYNDGSTGDVTSQATWSYSPNTPTDAGVGENISVTATASFGGKTSQKSTSGIVVTKPAFKDDFGLGGTIQYIYHTEDSVNYYMNFSSLNSKGAPKATTTKADATQLTFNIVGDNTFEIYNGENYLYGTADNNGLRLGDQNSSNRTWLVEDGETSKTGDYNIKNVGTSRYLTLYNKDDFRIYTSATATNRITNSNLEEYIPPVKPASLTLDTSSYVFAGTSDTAKTVTATVKGLNNKDVTTEYSIAWTSGNSAVATVNNGVITPVGAGTTTITATIAGSQTESGNTLTATVSVTVRTFSIEYTGSTLLKVDDEVNLSNYLNPNPAFSGSETYAWSSTNSTLVSVSSSGLVKAVGETTSPVTISLTVTDEGKTYSDSVQFEVKSSIVNPARVELSKSSSVLTLGGSNDSFTATVYGENDELATSQDINISGYDSSIITVTKLNNTVTISPVTAGTTSIKVNFAGGETATEQTFNVTVNYAPVTSVSIEVDKNKLYTNQTAAITVTVNQYASSDGIVWSISNKDVASIEKVSGNIYELTPKTTGTITVSGTLNSLQTNVLTFDICENLNAIMYAAPQKVDVTATYSGGLGSSNNALTSVTDNQNNVWTVEHTDTTYINGKQIGSKNNPDNVTFTLSGNTKTVKSISFTGRTGGSHKYEFSVGGTVYGTGSLNSTSDTYTETGNKTGDVVIKIKDASKAFYFEGITIVYEDTVTGEPVEITNKAEYFDAQKAVVTFAHYLMDTMEGQCGNDGFNTLDKNFISAWNSVATQYSSIRGGLSGTDLEMFDAMIKNAVARLGYGNYKTEENADILQCALYRYETIVKRDSSLSKFLSGQRTVSAPKTGNPIASLSNVDNSVWVISAVALVGLTAIGGYFFYRKRKEI